MNDTIPELLPAVFRQNGSAILAGSVFRQEAPYVAYRIGLRILNPQTTAIDGVDPAAFPIGGAVAPNPSDRVTKLLLRLEQEGEARVNIYDARGRRIRILHSGELRAGRTALVWDGRDRDGRPVPPGVYFARVASEAGERIVKISRR